MNYQTQSIIEVKGLTRDFGKTRALNRINLEIPKGTVYGLVGANGAGKTTLIKHVIGLLQARTGSVKVFGLDPVNHPVDVLSRIGYLSEINDLPEWMTVGEVIRFTSAFYKNWDEEYAESLRKTFELVVHKKVKQMSKGQRARLGLLVALAYKAEILVLDEPSSGLDPLVRRDILRAIIKTISEEGRTVLFSSHLLEEVERVADHIAIIEKGNIIENDTLENLKQNFHRIIIKFETEYESPPETDGCISWQGSGKHWTAFYQGEFEHFRSIAENRKFEIVERHTPALNDIFVALVGDQHNMQDANI